MRTKYQQPELQEHLVTIDSHLLIGSNIGGGGEGNEGDVKGFVPFDESDNESIFEENSFE